MIYRICQVWGDSELHELEACQRPEQVTCFREGADTNGDCGYGKEYVRSLNELSPGNWQPAISYTDPVPNTLDGQLVPINLIEPTACKRSER